MAEFYTILWRRLDVAGMDACQFRSHSDGWTIQGNAAFMEAGRISGISYCLHLDGAWNSLAADIEGFVGTQRLSLVLRKSAEGWSVNGEPIQGIGPVADIDLGFTPATNTNALRRLKLDIGCEAAVTALWLNSEDWTLKPLRQSYRRLAADRYLYASPAHDYRETITVDPFGIVRDYPGLWAAEAG